MPVWSVAICSVTGLVAKAGWFVNREAGCYPGRPLLHFDGAGIAEGGFMDFETTVRLADGFRPRRQAPPAETVFGLRLHPVPAATIGALRAFVFPAHGRKSKPPPSRTVVGFRYPFIPPNGKNNLFGLLPLSPQKRSEGGRIIIPGRPLTF